MDKIKIDYDKLSNEDAATILENTYHPLMGCNLITFFIFYIMFLLIEIMDIFVEIFKYDKEFLLFFYLRYFFFGFSLIAHVIVIFAIINYFSINAKLKKNEIMSNIIYNTFLKVIGTIFFVWSIVLFCMSIPRMIIFVNKREKLGGFISTMIYFKTFILIPIYLNAILLYLMFGHSQKLEEKRILD